MSEIPSDMKGLIAAVSDLPAEHRAKLTPHLESVVQNTTRRRKVLGVVQESLSQLRLDLKYLVFDLEATRRERDALRS
jgi:hypothetical protein